jgi:hypothetical protein
MTDTRSKRTPFRRTSIALVFLASIIGFFAVFAVWAKRQVLETNTWTDTSTKLLANHDVQTALSTFLVDEIYANVDVEAELRKALPPRADVLAGPAAGGIREIAYNAALRALATTQVQEAWKQANAQAHAAFINLIEGGGSTLSTTGGDVTLNLEAVAEQVGSRAGVDVASKLPPDAAQLELIHSDQLGFAQDMVNLLRKLAYILPFVALGLYALAIYLARGRRRETVRAAGLGFIAIGIVVLIARGLAGNLVVDSLASTDSVKPAVDAVWSIGTSLLSGAGAAMIGYGIVIVLGAFLAGPTPIARACRRDLTPVLRDRKVGYAVLVVILLLAFWWSPTEGFRRLIPSLVLIALLVAGFEGLRRQAIRDFPDETWDTASARWRQRFESGRGMVGAGGGSAEAPAAGAAEDVRLSRLTELARLRDAGVLDADEFLQEKRRILASS